MYVIMLTVMKLVMKNRFFILFLILIFFFFCYRFLYHFVHIFSFFFIIFKFLFALFIFIFISIKWGSSALMKASVNGHLEVVRLLLDRGANIDVVNNVNLFFLSYFFKWNFVLIIVTNLNIRISKKKNIFELNNVNK